MFIFTFFPWVGVYPGGVADATQNMWQAAFSGYSEDQDVKFVVDDFPTYTDKNGERSTKPGYDVLLIFYFVVLIPTLVIVIGCVALPYLPSQNCRPPRIQFCRGAGESWAALDLILLLFLVLQMVLGFSLVNNVSPRRIARSPPAMRSPRPASPRPRWRGRTPLIEGLSGKNCGRRSGSIWS